MNRQTVNQVRSVTGREARCGYCKVVHPDSSTAMRCYDSHQGTHNLRLIDTDTLQTMQRDLNKRIQRNVYANHPDLLADAEQQRTAIGFELLRRDIQELHDDGRAAESVPERQRDAALATLILGATV